ncbi:DoxX family protein [Williamsia deligens]|uniref:DoxX family protein n=1 Tax=Williamsia deligens TaxID=321325 RepID=A0ABW3GAI6_9NOCA|nr:DoxX family protein [Williamsia deligens]MCP2193229.1 putative oxidoreductase [Williamsia deligens]
MDSSRSITSLVARVILGIIFIMHGWQKLHTNGIGATEKGFRAMDVPFPEFSAHYATWVEFVGGILLIVGVLVPLVSILLIIDMAGAIITVHADKGFWNSDGGYEFPLALIAALVAVGLVNTGRTGVDGYLVNRRRRART